MMAGHRPIARESSSSLGARPMAAMIISRRSRRVTSARMAGQLTAGRLRLTGTSTDGVPGGLPRVSSWRSLGSDRCLSRTGHWVGGPAGRPSSGRKRGLRWRSRTRSEWAYGKPSRGVCCPSSIKKRKDLPEPCPRLNRRSNEPEFRADQADRPGSQSDSTGQVLASARPWIGCYAAEVAHRRVRLRAEFTTRTINPIVWIRPGCREAGRRQVWVFPRGVKQRGQAGHEPEYLSKRAEEASERRRHAPHLMRVRCASDGLLSLWH